MTQHFVSVFFNIRRSEFYVITPRGHVALYGLLAVQTIMSSTTSLGTLQIDYANVTTQKLQITFPNLMVIATMHTFIVLFEFSVLL